MSASSIPAPTRWTVRHLSFTLKAGEVVALVGENGAGKTTLVKLLTRLYDPDEGRILLDGRDLREYDVEELRGSMGVIFQDFVRYNFTAGDNIAVGRIVGPRRPRNGSSGRPSRSHADEVIARLPDGYGQRIGKRFKNGVELSGGEWQKIAIARAYMREAEVLILDEPTAALDARAEFEVFQRFKELSRGKTAVLISHRFSSVRMADRIFVLRGRQGRRLGTHEELVAQARALCRAVRAAGGRLPLGGGSQNRRINVLWRGILIPHRELFFACQEVGGKVEERPKPMESVCELPAVVGDCGKFPQRS